MNQKDQGVNTSSTKVDLPDLYIYHKALRLTFLKCNKLSTFVGQKFFCEEVKGLTFVFLINFNNSCPNRLTNIKNFLIGSDTKSTVF